ncbi:MAG: alpha-2-macroglobulin family protein [Labilithrix sp.]
MNRFAAAFLVLPLLALFASGCPGPQNAVPPAKAPAPAAPEGPLTWKMSKSGLGFRISNADEDADKPSERKVPAAITLNAADAKAIAARLPAIKTDPDDEKDFNMRAKSIPAPKPGKTVTEAFPPPIAPPPASVNVSGPLKLERHAPEGKVELAPHLSMTFTQPMVAVTSVDELKEHPPVKLVPEPAGKWRWLGTRTVMFAPEKRFPMATEYSVEIPASTKSMSGNALSKEEKWTFTTPPPTVKSQYPEGHSEPLDPIAFIEFDQMIEPRAMLSSIEMKGGDGRNVPIQIAEADEIEANDYVRRLTQQAEKGRWIAFRPSGRLPTATHFTVTVKAGAPSAEGPRKTEKAQSFGFSTYGPMRVIEYACTYSSMHTDCPPMAPMNVYFSNPIDEKKFDKSMVSVKPELAGMKIAVNGSYLTISGKTKGRTKYKVNVNGAMPDVHKQTMGDSKDLDFEYGSAAPTMFGVSEMMIVLDPALKAKEYPVYSINEPGLHVKLYSVGPSDWASYMKWAREWERPRKLPTPGKLVSDKTIHPKKNPDELVTTPIDLSAALNGGFGSVLLVVEPTHTLDKWETRPELHLWIQSTQIGLDAMVEADQVTAWTTALSDGKPVDGVDVELLGAGSGKTDAQGLAKIALDDKHGRLLVARKGKDVMFSPENMWGESSFQKVAREDYMRWFVYSDRGMYKPSEEVRFKAWVRKDGHAKGGDIDGVPNINGKTARWTIHDPRGAELGKGTTKVDEFGSFDLAFKLPNNANLGSARVDLAIEGTSLLGQSTSQYFEIQEFRRPEFEVTARASEGPHEVGKHAIVTLSASYYSGGGLPDAPVEWSIERSTVGFTPPNRGEFHFGPEPVSFWSWRSSSSRKSDVKTETWSSKTNPQGVHRIRLDFDALEPSYPMSLDITGHVTDVNRQQWAGRTSMIVHPASVSAGVKLAKSFLRAGENIDTDIVVVDQDGKPAPGRHVTLKSARIDWDQVKGGEYEERELDVASCEVDSPTAPTPANERLHCAFPTKEGGTYRITAIVTDATGRKSQTVTSLYVMGTNRPKDRGLEKAKVNLVSDKKDYRPGDTAEVLVVAPFAPAEGVLSVRRQGLVHLERFTMATTSQAMKVKLPEDLVPNAEIRIDLVGQDTRTDDAGNPDERLPKRPAYATGSIQARVLPTARTLDVKASGKLTTLAPGGSTTVEVDVKDSGGRAVSDAEVAVMVVDEAVLALSGYKTPDPISQFYSSRGSDVRSIQMRNHVQLAEPDLTKLSSQVRAQSTVTKHNLGGGAFGGAPGGPRGMPAPSPTVMAEAAAAPAAPAKPKAAAFKKEAREIADREMDDVAEEKRADTGKSVSGEKKAMQVRSDFSALALWSPAVKTNGQGHASVALKLPDNLTRYRVMAVAATKDKHFGNSESTITAKLPLMARPSAPRFLNFGDKFELPIVLQNQTDKEIEVGVVARATNATIAEPSAKRVKIAPNDRVEVRFNAGTMKVGTARFQFGVASGGFSDASEINLPVYTPATTEAFATYGEIDDGAMAQPVKMPPNVFSQFGGLEITTSSTQVQALTDALIYLVKYPYECNEQIASRVISIAALRDVLTAFKAKDLPSPAALNASMKEDFEKLKRHQRYDGGWGFWQEEPWPYLTIHVAHALVRAKEKGYAPDEEMLRKANYYMRNIESHIPHWYGPEARRAIIAYSLYVRHRMKDPDAAKAKAIMSEAGGADKLGIEAVGWIWPTISEDKSSTAELEQIRRHVSNRVTETAGAAHFVSGYKDSDWVILNSDRRADGVLLEAMIGDQKDATLIPKLVKGLLGHRKAGRWGNTQENAFVLLALDRYFNTYEKITPDFVARAWLGNNFAGEHQFKGRTTEESFIGIPMSWLAQEKAKEQNLIISKDGPGRLYYRVGMQYAPTDLKLPPADYGFVVQRVYEGVDKPDDVKREGDGTWKVKAGAKVRVRLTMVAQSRRYHVALVDQIPAGLEPMNPALAVTGEIPKDPKDSSVNKNNPYWYWSRTWYEHQNMRDERVEAFASMLWEGVWDYSYVARATTPGTFVVPPAKAEEMYSPETFGRSAGDRLVIE